MNQQLTAQRQRETGDGEVLVDGRTATAPDVSIVIPTMNEEEGIGDCIRRAKTALSELGATGEVVVSDSSSDRTPEIARELGARVVYPDREGYGYAYRYGFSHARGDLIAMADGDTTYDFHELPRLVERLDETGADMVMGSRLEGDIKDGAMPFLHEKVGNPALTKFLNVFYGAGVSDAHSGFRVFRSNLVDELELQSDGMEFASEMIMRASAENLVIEEVPITYHEREGDATLETFRDGWRHVKFMLTNAPGRLFLLPALIFSLLGVGGLAAGALGLSGTLEGHVVIAGAMLTLIGYQVGVLGLLSTMVADPIKAPQDRITSYLRGRLDVEEGLVVGLGMLVAGGAVAIDWVSTWLATGVPPAIGVAAVALTAAIVGCQTVFYSFFLSAVGRTGPETPTLGPTATVEATVAQREEAD